MFKVHKYAVGDYVRVSNDLAAVRTRQEGHGEWTDNMRAVSTFQFPKTVSFDLLIDHFNNVKVSSSFFAINLSYMGSLN